MRKTLSVVAFLAVAAVPAFAQGGAGMGRGQAPDHWMTIDSIVAAVGITDAQKPEVTKHYDVLNGIVKKFVTERAAAMQAARDGGAMPDTAAMRVKGEETSKEFDAHHKAIRDLLTPEQQAKFDALQKPRFQRGRRGGGGGQ